MDSPAFLYLHGFASSVRSTKARAFVAWGAERGLAIQALDLRVPSFEHLRFSAMKAVVRAAIDASSPDAPERARAVLIGSSLGGLTAFRVAEEDPRVCAVFAMAPAFRLGQRWPERIGAAAFESWKKEGFRAVDDYATRSVSRVDFGFVEELMRLDGGDDASPAWPDVRVPTCIVHGLRDDVVEPELSREWAAGKRHVRLVEVDDTHELGASIGMILEEAAGFLRPFMASAADT